LPPSLCATAASAQVTFFEHDGFQGQQFTADRQVGNFDRAGFNDRASSVIVRGGWWEACEDARFGGQCVTLRPGSYSNLAAIGLNDRISSVRPVDGPNYGGHNAPAYGSYNEPAPRHAYDTHDYRRRGNERLFEAPVTSVRAVVGTPRAALLGGTASGGAVEQRDSRRDRRCRDRRHPRPPGRQRPRP
jgi:hypothetical protein